MDNNQLLNNEVNPAPNQEEKEENIEGRVLYSNEELKTKSKRASKDLDNSKLFLRGSKEFKVAKDRYDRVQKLWEAYTQIKNPSMEEVERVRGELINAMHMVDRYLDKKAGEKDKSKNAKRRIESMGGAFAQLEEQLAVLNDKREKIENEPAPSIENLAGSSKKVAQEMKDATLFLRGSKEFDNAMDAFNQASKELDNVMKKYAGKESEIPPTEISHIRDRLQKSQRVISIYLSKKSGEELGENTRKRVNAMRAGHTILGEGIRKMEQLREAFENGPAKPVDKINTQLQAAAKANEEAESGVYFGSDEYKEANKTVSEVSQRMAAIAAKGPDYVPSYQEIEEMRALTDEGLNKISKYLATKDGQKLEDKTLKRVQSMEKSMDAMLECKRKFKELNKANMEKANKLTEDELSLKDDTIVVNLNEYRRHVDGKRVWFGSTEFKNGMEAFDEMTRKESEKSKSQKTPSEKELKERIKDIGKAMETMAKYIDKKEEEIKKNKKPLDRKGQVRLAEMKAAYAQAASRKARLESKLELTTKKGKELQQKKIDNRVKEYDKQIRGKKGLELNDAILVSEAVHTLKKYGKKTDLTPAQKEGIRRAYATLFLHEKLQGPEGAKLKESMPRTMKGYGKKVVEMAKSKEFKELFPDKDISPESVRKMMADPKEVKRSLNALNESLKKSAEKLKVKENHTGKEIEMQNLKPNLNGPNK